MMALLLLRLGALAAAPAKPPSIVIFFADNLGYGTSRLAPSGCPLSLQERRFHRQATSARSARPPSRRPTSTRSGGTG